MGLLFSLFAVIALVVIVFIGVQAAGLEYLPGPSHGLAVRLRQEEVKPEAPSEPDHPHDDIVDLLGRGRDVLRGLVGSLVQPAALPGPAYDLHGLHPGGTHLATPGRVDDLCGVRDIYRLALVQAGTAWCPVG